MTELPGKLGLLHCVIQIPHILQIQASFANLLPPKWIVASLSYQQCSARLSPSPLCHNLDGPLMGELLSALTILRCIFLHFMIYKEAFIIIQDRQVIKQPVVRVLSRPDFANIC